MHNCCRQFNLDFHVKILYRTYAYKTHIKTKELTVSFCVRFHREAQFLRDKVIDSRLRGRWIKPHRGHYAVSLSRDNLPSA